MVDTTEETVLLSLSAPLLLALMVVVTSGIGHEVHRPAEELLTDDPAGS